MITFSPSRPTLYPHADTLFPHDAETLSYFSCSTLRRSHGVKRDEHMRAVAVRMLNYLERCTAPVRVGVVIAACGGGTQFGSHAIKMLCDAGHARIVWLSSAKRARQRVPHVVMVRA